MCDLNDRLKFIVEKVVAGESITYEEAVALPSMGTVEELCAASAEITRRKCTKDFELCSIINAKSGRCPEDCHWCAQSAHYNTGVREYPLVPLEETMRHATVNDAAGIKRFSWVTSGRRPSAAEIKEICRQAVEVGKKTGLKFCASLGLIGEDDLRSLKDAGITRYHCNLETAPSYFKEMCSTHTTEQKMKTIESARKVGMEVCCGGIIGMGETWEQRVEFAFYLRNTGTVSIPLNLLQPIPGTPLERQRPLTSEEIIHTVVMFRFVHPEPRLRFAGGRAQLDRETLEILLKAGVNAAISGDLLTTVGSKVREDVELVKSCGYEC